MNVNNVFIIPINLFRVSLIHQIVEALLLFSGASGRRFNGSDRTSKCKVNLE